MKKILITLAVIGTMALAGCSIKGQEPEEPIVYPQVGPLLGEKIADFAEGEADEIFASDGWSNSGDPAFNAVWKKENVTYSNGQMHLSIKAEQAEYEGINYPYTAGEARSHHMYSYGDFEVRMKPTNVTGSVSTFFVCTGPYDLVDGVPNKWDEIDIEFLGKDTTKVQFNYFVDSHGGHEHMHDLGFDASQEFHNYGFRWEEDKISWLVDGETVYQVVKDNNKNSAIPSTPGRILTSYWPSKAESWSGRFAGATEDTVDYQWIKASGETSYTDADKPEPKPEPSGEIDWSKVSETDATFTGDSIYTISKENGVSTATYSSAFGWKNIHTNIANVANNNNIVNLTLKNNSNSTSTVRVDVNGSTKVGNCQALNTKAYAEGHTEVSTDLEWGGSQINLAANEEVEFIVEYDTSTTKGAATELLLYLDSLQPEQVAHEGGSVSISKIKFANQTREPSENVSLSFGADTDVYTIDPKGTATESVTVSYSNLVGNSYANFNAQNLTALASGKTSFALTMKNNGASPAAIRVDVCNSSWSGINTSATAQGHDEIWTDPNGAGSKILLAADEEVVFTITFNGEASVLMIFLDSCWDTADARTGSVTFSNFIFA